jgi:glucosamine--fructose-6-phosphate aminotransferase (isomerizing)
VCGIVGYAGYNEAVTFVMRGLGKLEYRGYDSAGIAYLDRENDLRVCKKKGRLSVLAKETKHIGAANIAIGHTRWATHGEPSDINAHPHADCSGRIALVHNGIIENYAALREQLVAEGHCFVSETDTETVVHLIEKYYAGDLEAALRSAVTQLQGSFSLAVICQDEPGKIVAAKKESPLIVGLGVGEHYIASDIPAILGKTRDVYILDDHELVTITAEGVAITDFSGNPVDKAVFTVHWDLKAAEKNGFPHFMLKEIYEQPQALRETMRGMVKADVVDLSDLDVTDLFDRVNKLYIVGCGTAYHAGLVGRLALEKLAGVPTETDIASEFRYRDVIWQPDALMIIVSQSGETADSLAALKAAKYHGIKVLAITNVVGSAMARQADKVIYTHAGPEISVASTKAYSTQVLVFYMLALELARIRGTLPLEQLKTYARELMQLDRLAEQVLELEEEIKATAQRYRKVKSAFFLGRGFDYAVALEGALKLKEISYIHAEAYAAGELKHGPLALITPGVPVLTLITQDDLTPKTLSNVKEVKARGARVVGICKAALAEQCAECDDLLVMPDVNPLFAPIIAALPLQLFAYYMATERRRNVDKPRNLAKSVTVE